VGIKARPGWLIVVSGHTDNTGSVQLNQTLSLQRAEAVRNWMRDTGDVRKVALPCRVTATADRLHQTIRLMAVRNRRVEISLVPQADACRLPGAKHASQDVRDVSTEEMEK
jgi:outer membrane protein OmpA-like peptidoglycan-associated protein